MLREKKRGMSVAIRQTLDMQFHKHLAIAQWIDDAIIHTKTKKSIRFNVVQPIKNVHLWEYNA